MLFISIIIGENGRQGGKENPTDLLYLMGKRMILTEWPLAGYLSEKETQLNLEEFVCVLPFKTSPLYLYLQNESGKFGEIPDYATLTWMEGGDIMADAATLSRGNEIYISDQVQYVTGTAVPLADILPSADVLGNGSAFTPETFVAPARKSVTYEITSLLDYNFLLRTFYIVDPSTSVTAQQIDPVRMLEMDFSIDQKEHGPQILIYHTHSQEAFADSVVGDESTTIVGAGEYLAQILEECYGYEVLHYTESFDTRQHNYAYSYAEPVIEEILRENPSIQVVIDLHRDEMAEGTRLVTDINGRPTAQFMFFNGLSYLNELGHISYLYNPNLLENLAFSFQMQLIANMYYPGLARRIYLKGYRYNMHLTGQYLLIELGAQNNTVEEIHNACYPLADILDRVLSGRG